MIRERKALLGSYISAAACTLYNTNTRTIKLNKGTGYFAFHLLGTGSRDRAPGSTPRINSKFSYFYWAISENAHLSEGKQVGRGGDVDKEYSKRTRWILSSGSRVKNFCIIALRLKVKLFPYSIWRHRKGIEVKILAFLTLVLTNERS